MRGFEQAAPALLEHVIRPLDADVFVHTWSDIGSSSILHKRGMPYPLRVHLHAYDDVELFRATFPVTQERLFSVSRPITEADVKAAYGECEVVVEDYPDDEAAFFGVSAPDDLLAIQPRARWTIPMLYKIHQANQMKVRREQLTGETYDLVIRIRPDLQVANDPTAGRRDEPGTFFHHVRSINPDNRVGDQLFFGGSEVMDRATAGFEWLPGFYASIAGRVRKGDVGDYWAEGLFSRYIREGAGIDPVPFRTERLNEPTRYPLLDATVEEVSFPAVFKAMREDLPTVPRDAALDKLRTGLARAQFHYTRTVREPAALQEARWMVEVAEAEDLFDPSVTAGFLAYQGKDFAGARRHFQLAVDREPDAALPQLWLGRSLLESGDAEEALTHLERSIEAKLEYNSQKPAQRRNAFYWRAQALLRLERWSAAAEDMHTAMAYGQKASRTTGEVLGRSLFMLGRYHEALPHLAEWVKHVPKDETARNNLSWCHVRVGAPGPVLTNIWVSRSAGRQETSAQSLAPSAAANWQVGNADVARARIEEYLDREVDSLREALDLVLIASEISPEFGASTVRRLRALHPHDHLLRLAERGLLRRERVDRLTPAQSDLRSYLASYRRRLDTAR